VSVDALTLSLLRLALVVLLYVFLFAVIVAVSRQFGPRLKRGAQALRLQITRSEAVAPGWTYDVVDQITIGRAPGCAVSLPDAYVSDLHARVRRHDDRYDVEDLGSRNGTYVNGRLINGAKELRKGDTIQVGQTTLELVP